MTLEWQFISKIRVIDWQLNRHDNNAMAKEWLTHMGQ